MLTQERLMLMLRYEPDTGLFYWKATTSTRNLVGKIAGGLDDKGYWRIKIDGVKYRAHRLAFLYMTGSMPDFVDHENTDKSDTRWENLRPATKPQNGYNRKNIRSNTTGIKNVCISTDSRGRPYVDARIHVANGKIRMKYFSINKWGREKALELAAEWVRQTRVIEHGEFANHG